jgi:hypothetical protein
MKLNYQFFFNITLSWFKTRKKKQNNTNKEEND